MITFDKPVGGKLACITLDQLVQYPGWELVALVPSTVVVEEASTGYKVRSRQVPGTKAIIRLNEDSAIHGMQRTLEAVQITLRQSEQKRVELHQTCRDQERELEDMKTRRAERIEQLNKLREEHERLQAQHQLLEEDLGKIREHIGTKVFGEVVGR